MAPNLQPLMETIIPGFGSQGNLTLLSVREAPQLSTMAAVRHFACISLLHEHASAWLPDNACIEDSSQPSACTYCTP